MATTRTATKKKSEEEERKICFPQFFVVLWMSRENLALEKKRISHTQQKSKTSCTTHQAFLLFVISSITQRYMLKGKR